MNKWSKILLTTLCLSGIVTFGNSGNGPHQKYNVNFVLPHGSITSEKLNRMRAGHGDVLFYDQPSSDWGPYSINYPLITYKGLWDARLDSQGGGGDPPDTNPDNGDYYFVSVAGNTDLDGLTIWDKGDFAIYGNNGWELINAGSMVSSLNGRTGFVSAAANDISWGQIDKSTSSIGDFKDVNIEGVQQSEGLTWKSETMRWEAVATEAPPDSISADKMGDDAVSSIKIEDESLMNEDFSDTAEIAYSKLSIGSNDLSISYTDGLQDELDLKATVTGAIISGDLNLDGNNLTNVGMINGVDVSGLEASVGAHALEIDNLNTAVVPESVTGGGLYFTTARAKAAAVEDAIFPSAIDVAPSQNAVYDALAGKQDLLNPRDFLVDTLTTDSKGAVNIEPASEAGELRFFELAANGTDYIALKSPDALDANLYWTLPDSDSLYGEMLTPDGSGGLCFINPASIGGIILDVTASWPATSTGGSTPEISLVSIASSTESGYLRSADWTTFDGKQDGSVSLDAIAVLATTSGNYIIADGSTWISTDAGGAKIFLGLDKVENTKLSTWDGTPGSITTLGTISEGTWQGTILESAYLPDGGDWNLTSDLNIFPNTLVITAAGQVGVGTALPSAKLDVSGKVKVNDSTIFLQEDTGRDGANALRLQAIDPDIDGSFYLMPAGTSTVSYVRLYNDSDPNNTGAVDLKVDNDTFEIGSSVWGVGTPIINTAIMIDSVGISASGSDERMVVDGAFSLLEVATPGSILGYGKMYVLSDNSTLYYIDDSGQIIDMTLQPDNLGDHLALENIKLGTNKLVGDNGSDGISIDNSGNVGIETTTPAASLDVKSNLLLGISGDVSLGSDILFKGDGLIAAETDLFLNIASIGAGGNLYIGQGAATSGAINLLTILNDGNVGIGTVTPNEKLHVEGTVSLRQSATPAVTGSYGKVFVDSSGSSLFYSNSSGTVDITLLPDNLGNHLASMNLDLATFQLVGDGGSSGISILSDGKVGINITTPAALLHINGNLRIDDGTATSTIYGKDGVEVFTSGTGNGMVVDFDPNSTETTPSYVQINNANVGNDLRVEPEGNETNIDLIIKSLGSGGTIISDIVTSNVGIGTTLTNELLTVEGVLSMAEGGSDAIPPSTYGKIYVTSKAPDPGADLFFQDDTGEVIKLTKNRIFALVYDQKGHSEDGGEATEIGANNPNIRDLNTMEGDTDEVGVTIDGVNTFTLQPGKFAVRWVAPAFMVGRHYTLLRDIDNSRDVAYGSSAYSVKYKNKEDESSQSSSKGFAAFSLSAATRFQVNHYVSSSEGNDYDLGSSLNGIPDANATHGSIYTQVIIEKLD